MAVHDQVAACVLHHAGEVAEYRVVFQQVHHIVDIRFPQVDAADVEGLRVFAHNAQDDASDTAEAVDADLDSHVVFLSTFVVPPCGPFFVPLYIIIRNRWIVSL